MEPGFLVFSTELGQVFAAGFDLAESSITSQPVLMLSGVNAENRNFSEFALSGNGNLAYRTDALDRSGSLVWVSRDGVIQEIDADWTGVFLNPRLSPDGSQVALDELGDETTLWVRDLDRGTRILVRSDASQSRPAWTPDGRSVTYTALGGGGRDLWTVRADRSGPPRLTLDAERDLGSGIWSDDGEWLVYVSTFSGTEGEDLFGASQGVDSAKVTITDSPFRERAPSLSPDGRFLAYVSNESGQNEVFVTAFPEAQEWRVTVSRNGGAEPIWGKTGSELFYRSREGQMVAVEVITRPQFSLGEEQNLFATAAFQTNGNYAQYDVAPDDQRFLMIRSSRRGTLDIIFVGNFLEEVQNRVGGG
jgi:serine/threonine-protein kinase